MFRRLLSGVIAQGKTSAFLGAMRESSEYQLGRGIRARSAVWGAMTGQNNHVVIAADFNTLEDLERWSDLATTRTMSRIDFPRSGSEVSKDGVMLGGIAFAGSRGIRAVELSMDDGLTWQPAALEDLIGPLSWRFWTFAWQPTKTGSTGVLVRATDGEGQVQTATQADPFPDGATGYHRIFLRVA